VNFFDRVFKKDNDREKMNFSIEIGPHSDIETLPALSDVYVTMLPGGDYKETADKALELVKKGFNPVPHFPARSMNNEQELKDYVNKCKDGGVKQALIIGGGRDPVGKFDSSIQLLETGYFEKNENRDSRTS
jgi:methylenetetrahydrofolate reductase (NADPH)